MGSSSARKALFLHDWRWDVLHVYTAEFPALLDVSLTLSSFPPSISLLTSSTSDRIASSVPRWTLCVQVMM